MLYKLKNIPFTMKFWWERGKKTFYCRQSYEVLLGCLCRQQYVQRLVTRMIDRRTAPLTTDSSVVESITEETMWEKHRFMTLLGHRREQQTSSEICGFRLVWNPAKCSLILHKWSSSIWKVRSTHFIWFIWNWTFFNYTNETRWLVKVLLLVET